MSRAPFGSPGTCGACAHWLLSEAAEWQKKMEMACCDQKRTKSISLAHFRACEYHKPAGAGVVDLRRGVLGNTTGEHHAK
jgi:hypothetical protein